MKLKWVLTAVVAVIVALVVAGYAVLASLDVEQYRGTIEAEAKKATGRDLTLAGPIDLKVSLTPAITVEDVTLGNADWGSRSQMVKLKRFELQVALLPLLTGEVHLQRLILIEPDILLETNAEGQGNWSLQPVEGEASPAPSEGGGDLKLSIDEVRIEGGSLTYRDGKSGEETRVQLSALDAKAGGAGEPIALNAQGSFNEQPFSLDGSVGSFAQLESGPFPVKLTAEAAGATVALDGAIAQPKSGQGIDLTVSAKGDELGALSALAGTPVPALGAYDVAAKITQDGEAYKLSGFSAKLAGSDIAGEATLALTEGRPSLQGDFTSQLIDLTKLAPPGEGGAGTSGGAGESGAASPYVFTEEPLPLEGLRAADATLSLQAAKVRLQDKMALDNLQVTLALQNGRLQITPLSADFSGGRIDAAVELDGSQAAPPLSTTLQVDRLDYGQLLRTMELDDTVAGTLNVDVDVKGKGGSMRAIASSLNGHSEIVSNEGMITNRLLKIIAAGLGDVLGPLLGGDRDANLNCMISRFDIRGGVATSKALVIDTEQFTISGGGTVDLRTEELDLNFDTATREPSIASLAVPFVVTGTLKSPSVAPDPVGTALGVAKAAGMVINPVAGIGVLIGSQVASGGDENPCVVAVDSSGSGSGQGSTIDSITKGAGEAVDGAAEGAAGAVEDAVEGVGKGLEGLFGN